MAWGRKQYSERNSDVTGTDGSRMHKPYRQPFQMSKVLQIGPIREKTNKRGTKMKTTKVKRCQTQTPKMGKAVVFAAIVATLTAGQALASAGAKRPATVPADYVITPFGYFHPSCVNHLAKGDILLKDEKAIQHANGNSDKIPECTYPHYEADGEEAIGDGPTGNPPSIGHSWVEYVSATTTTSYGALFVTWIVPPPPKNDDGQTLYFFPGLEQDEKDVTILQPVLGWNADFDSAWGIASWNCCVNGAVNESLPLPVNSGDEISGHIGNNCGPPPHAKETCPSWAVSATDYTIELLDGISYESGLTETSNYGQTFNWAFSGVMEVYNIAQCGDYPSSTRLLFDEVSLLNYKFVLVNNPHWSGTVVSGLSPQCGYGAGPRTQTTLDFSPID
jgi:hypothetical protein